MTFTLAWKELREHQGIWITMVCMTVGLGLGLAKVVSLNDAHMALPVAAFTILGMAATYGVVCGSMMFAGEHEGGTLVFLDIFLGRRGLLWTGKVAIGTLLVMLQALCVAMILALLDQQAPRWTLALIGYSVENAPGGAVTDPSVWYLILPVVTLEAFAWGLLGSSLTRRVLGGAAIAAVGFTPVWLLAITAPGPVFFPFRVMLAAGLLVVSASTFLNQSREASLGPPAPAEPEPAFDPKEEFLRSWDRHERRDVIAEAQLVEDEPVSVPADAAPKVADDPLEDIRVAMVSRAFEEEPEQAESPREVLWWLTVKQGRPVLWSLLAAGLFLGLVVIPASVQVLWPLATLLLGVACGTAAFAPEQRDLSYQFLAAQHFPLRVIWRFKIQAWLVAAVLVAAVTLMGTLTATAVSLLRPGGLPAGQFVLLGTFADLLGPTLFFGLWLIYGFCVGQVFVWLCRKTILALLVSLLMSMAAISMWLPSLLCGGMNGWQLWVPPLIMLTASGCLMRAWTGGRIWEQRPIMALVGFGAGIGVWALINFGYRAWEIPNVGTPIDTVAYRASLPANQEKDAAKAIHKAIVQFDEAQVGADGLLEGPWLKTMEKAARLPIGVLETPQVDGQPAQLRHLSKCRRMARDMWTRARTAERRLAFDYLAQVLALSRNLRNKAPLDSYLTGIDIESEALEGLDHWLDRGKPSAKMLRRVLDELNRHAEETPPPLDCLQTECFRSGGMLANPNTWSLSARDGGGKIPEQWLAGCIALSMETPWEDERKTRLWQLVWAGLFRGIQTPHWQLPNALPDPAPEKNATRNVLQGWLPAPEGPGSGVTRARMIRLLDSSWLADERLFSSVPRLRDVSTRARWHVDAARQVVALALYRIEEGRDAKDLNQLTPKYLPTGLPVDPYSGQAYRYRAAADNGPAQIWSTGPDGIDHGGRNHGGHLLDGDAQWQFALGLDLITLVPQWR